MTDACVHVVSQSLDPARGGQEKTALRVAGHLARAGARVRAYGIRDAIPGGDHPDGSSAPPPSNNAPPGVEVVDLSMAGRALMAPLASGGTFSSVFERHHAETLMLRAAIRRALDEEPERTHVVVSLFLTEAGFVAQSVAEELGLRHLASIRGSDFNRDARDPYQRPAVARVLGAADLVVSNAHESARVLGPLRRGRPIRVILNSVRLPDEEWTPGEPSAPVRIVSDCGFWFKKGTHVLLRAARTLLDEGSEIEVVVLGSTEDERSDFWEAERERCLGAHPDAFRFEGWVAAEEVNRLLLDGGLYVSATLGEGSSMARLAALALGMPMVSTRCGELPELAGGQPHVRLVEPGEPEDFTAALRAAVEELGGGRTALPDQETLEGWRALLHPSREGREWREAVEELLALARGGTRRPPHDPGDAQKE